MIEITSTFFLYHPQKSVIPQKNKPIMEPIKYFKKCSFKKMFMGGLTGFLLIIVHVMCFGQDTLFMKDNTVIATKIIEVSPVEIKYKKAENINGPTYISNKKKIAKIKYSNGTVELLEVEKPQESADTERHPEIKKAKKPVENTYGQRFELVKSAGGKGNDVSNGIYAGGKGIYITGSFKSTVLFDSASVSSTGEDDVFIACYTDSCKLKWLKKIGGKGEDIANCITGDDDENIFIAGYFNGTISFGNTELTSYGTDIFIVKYDSAGTIKWAKKAGGASNDYAYALNTDASGNLYVTGDFSGSANFDDSTLVSAGMKDAFIAKYDSAGVLIWAKKAGGNKDDAGNGIYADNSGNVFLTGSFTDSASFGTAPNVGITSNGASDIFIAKYDAAGNLLWVNKAGGKNNDAGNSIEKDGFGNIYITGNFRNTAYFSDTSIISYGGSDMFVAKYNPDGKLLWLRSAGGNENDESNAISLDKSGNLFVTGSFRNVMKFHTTDLYSDEGTDIFIVKYDSIGREQWTTKAGGLSNDLAQGIDVDGTGNIYITGVFKELARFGKIKLYNVNASGTSDIFIAKIIQPVEKLCKCKDGKNVIKWQPFGLLMGYGRGAYERVINNKTSFQIELGYLNSQLEFARQDSMGGTGYLVTNNYNIILEHRHYFKEVLRSGYYAPFMRIKTGTNEFTSLFENGVDEHKWYYEEKNFSFGLGGIIGYQHIFRNCITIDAFIGAYAKIGSTYDRKYFSEDNTDEKIQKKFPKYTPFQHENTGFGTRAGIKLGYTF